jgi:probable rRNA maturation factor
MEISVSNEQSKYSLAEDALVVAVRAVLADTPYVVGSVDVAVIDDHSMRKLNSQYLQHDRPTDVLSFVLEREASSLEGQIVVSVETAVREAPQFGWSSDEELLLYVVHGALHLVGLNDKTAEETVQMRAAETQYLQQLGIRQAAPRLTPNNPKTANTPN